jgi:hypothetical protein
MSPRRGFGRGGCPDTMGSRPWLPHVVPLGLKQNPRSGDIAFSRNAATGCSHGRKPMDRGPPLAHSPKGTTGAMIHVAPSGLRTGRLPRYHGLTPMATTCRPVGTKTESAKRRHCI